MKVSEGYNEAQGYGKTISVLTHTRNGVDNAICMIFPHKLKRKYEGQVKRLYAEEEKVHPKEVTIQDLNVRKVNKDLTVDLSITQKNVKLINYTYKRKNLKFNDELENYYKVRGEM